MNEARDRAYEVALSDGDGDLDGIMRLQRANLEATLGTEAALRDGFVTVVHTREALAAMHALAPSVVVKDKGSGEVIAYAIVMPVECRAFVPVLDEMFEKLGQLDLGGARIYIMGQICIAREWRGQGIFEALYDAHRRWFADRWDLCVTDVALRNTRSLRAHERVGFKRLLEYRDAQDEWAMIALDLRQPAARVGNC